MSARSCLFFILLGFAHVVDVRAEFATVTIRNEVPRRDTEGNVIDAHDGCLQFFEGRYYLYGTAYGRSAGFGINNRFRVYSSADLMTWRFDGELLADPPRGVAYRPYVVHNPRTGLYVLWFNWYPRLWDGAIAVAVSESPTGPFRVVTLGVELSQARDRPGDGSLFVDADGSAYFIYTVIGQGHAVRVEKLTPDFLASTGEVSEVLARGCEAPVMFRRGDDYFALFDRNCCFCPEGSGARVFGSRSPLGPFTERNNINRDGAGRPIVAAQQTFVARMPGADGDVFLWMGDRWGSRPDGVKGHDFQFWSAPLSFDAAGDIAPMRNEAEWSARLRAGRSAAPPTLRHAVPPRPDPSPVIRDPCSGRELRPEEIDRGTAADLPDNRAG